MKRVSFIPVTIVFLLGNSYGAETPGQIYRTKGPLPTTARRASRL